MATMVNMNDSSVPHPYFPVGALMADYAANTTPTPVLLLYFVLGTGSILAGALAIARRAQPNLSRENTLTAMWFVLCGFIHLFFEGMYLSLHLPLHPCPV